MGPLELHTSGGTYCRTGDTISIVTTAEDTSTTSSRVIYKNGGYTIEGACKCRNGVTLQVAAHLCSSDEMWHKKASLCVEGQCYNCHNCEH